MIVQGYSFRSQTSRSNCGCKSNPEYLESRASKRDQKRTSPETSKKIPWDHPRNVQVPVLWEINLGSSDDLQAKSNGIQSGAKQTSKQAQFRQQFDCQNVSGKVGYRSTGGRSLTGEEGNRETEGEREGRGGAQVKRA